MGSIRQPNKKKNNRERRDQELKRNKWCERSKTKYNELVCKISWRVKNQNKRGDKIKPLFFYFSFTKGTKRQRRKTTRTLLSLFIVIDTYY